MRRRLYNECYNLAMTLLMSAAAAILLQKALLPHLDPWAGVLYCIPCLLVYPVGRLLHQKKNFIAIPIGAILTLGLSAIPIVLSWHLGILQVFAYVAIPILTFLLFSMPYINGSNILGTARFITGLVIFFIAILLKGTHGESYKSFLNTTAIVFLIAGLFTFNRENLRDAAKHSPSTGNGHYPPGMRRNNSIMLTGIVALALIIANFESLRVMAVEAVKFVIRQIFALIYFILSLIAGGGSGGDDTGGAPEGPMMGGEAAAQNPLVEMIVRIVTILILVIAALFLLYGIYKLIRKLIEHLPDWLRRLFGKLTSDNDQSYIDETEDLLGKGGLRKEFARGLSELWDRVTYRPAKFEDMPDNRAKVRFVFKRMLRKISDGKSHLLSQTPIELTGEADRVIGEDTNDFMEAYNRARYHNTEVSNVDAELAKKLLKRL